MATLWNTAGHYIFMLWFLSCIFFPRLISAVADWMSTYFHTWCGLKAHSHRARLRPSTSVDARLRASTDVDARRRTYTRVYVRRRASRDGRGRRRARCEWAFSANLRCRSETWCTRLTQKYRRQNSPKIRHLGTIAQLCRAISS